MENNQRLVTYVTKDVKEKLEYKANQLGLSVSCYLRHTIIELVKESE